MPKNVTVDWLNFAVGIEEVVGDIPAACSEQVSKAVERSTRRGVKAVKAHASGGGKHAWSGEYVNGFSSKVTKGVVSSGEIGNKAKPGLVHLLEKGHATLTGRRTAAYPHMAPAFDEIKEEFYKEVADAVGRALS